MRSCDIPNTCEAWSICGVSSSCRRPEAARRHVECQPPARTPAQRRHVGPHADECQDDDVTRTFRGGYATAQHADASTTATTTSTTHDNRSKQQQQTSNVICAVRRDARRGRQADETEATPDALHARTTQRTGAGVREDALPRHLHEGGHRHASRAHRIQSAGQCQIRACL